MDHHLDSRLINCINGDSYENCTSSAKQEGLNRPDESFVFVYADIFSIVKSPKLFDICFGVQIEPVII